MDAGRGFFSPGMGLVAAFLLATVAACSPVAVTNTGIAAQSSGNVAPATLSIQAPSSATALVGEPYALQPVVSNPAGGTLTFRITGKPAWATFDAATGVLSGTPTAGDIGTYGNIVITVNNGTDSASLALSIAVVSGGSGVASLTWTPPTQNTDGSALTNLAGYRVYYGTNRTALTRIEQVANPGASAHVVSTLLPGTWYFAVSAYNGAGAESALSNIGSKVIPP